MKVIDDQSHGTYQIFGKTSILGFLFQFLWIFIMGPIHLGRWERGSTYISFFIGLLVLIIWRSQPFRQFIEAQTSERSFPVRIFLANFAIILLFLSFFLLQWKYTHYPFQTLQSVVDLGFLAGGLLLAILALIANLIAYRIDRKNIR